MKKNFFSNFFFRFPGKLTSEKTFPPKKIGVRRCLGELGVSVGSFWVRICLVVFVGEFEPSAAVGFRSRVFSG
jgi:hypothetical protein